MEKVISKSKNFESRLMEFEIFHIFSHLIYKIDNNISVIFRKKIEFSKTKIGSEIEFSYIFQLPSKKSKKENQNKVIGISKSKIFK